MTPASFYLRSDGSDMSSQEKLAHLLDLGGLDYKSAAEIAGVAPLTIKAYRKPSSTRNVPAAILSPIESHVFQRLSTILLAAGYDVRRPS